MNKPSCIAPDCLFYCRSEEVCLLEEEDEIRCCCPCENGELEEKGFQD